MVNNSGNSQTQRELMIHVETRQDLPITNEETLDKSADSACWIVVDASRRLGLPPLSSLPLSRGGTDGRATFFKIKFTARSNGDDRSPSTRTCTHHSPLAAGDAGAALGRGHRHPPLSRTTVPPPLPSHFPLPSRYRVTEFAIAAEK